MSEGTTRRGVQSNNTEQISVLSAQMSTSSPNQFQGQWQPQQQLAYPSSYSAGIDRHVASQSVGTRNNNISSIQSNQQQIQQQMLNNGVGNSAYSIFPKKENWNNNSNGSQISRNARQLKVAQQSQQQQQQSSLIKLPTPRSAMGLQIQPSPSQQISPHSTKNNASSIFSIPYQQSPQQQQQQQPPFFQSPSALLQQQQQFQSMQSSPQQLSGLSSPPLLMQQQQQQGYNQRGFHENADEWSGSNSSSSLSEFIQPSFKQNNIITGTAAAGGGYYSNNNNNTNNVSSFPSRSQKLMSASPQSSYFYPRGIQYHQQQQQQQSSQLQSTNSPVTTPLFRSFNNTNNQSASQSQQLQQQQQQQQQQQLIGNSSNIKIPHRSQPSSTIKSHFLREQQLAQQQQQQQLDIQQQQPIQNYQLQGFDELSQQYQNDRIAAQQQQQQQNQEYIASMQQGQQQQQLQQTSFGVSEGIRVNTEPSNTYQDGFNKDESNNNIYINPFQQSQPIQRQQIIMSSQLQDPQIQQEQQFQQYLLTQRQQMQQQQQQQIQEWWKPWVDQSKSNQQNKKNYSPSKIVKLIEYLCSRGEIYECVKELVDYCSEYISQTNNQGQNNNSNALLNDYQSFKTLLSYVSAFHSMLSTATTVSPIDSSVFADIPLPLQVSNQSGLMQNVNHSNSNPFRDTLISINYMNLQQIQQQTSQQSQFNQQSSLASSMQLSNKLIEDAKVTQQTVVSSQQQQNMSNNSQKPSSGNSNLENNKNNTNTQDQGQNTNTATSSTSMGIIQFNPFISAIDILEAFMEELLLLIQPSSSEQDTNVLDQLEDECRYLNGIGVANIRRGNLSLGFQQFNLLSIITNEINYITNKTNGLSTQSNNTNNINPLWLNNAAMIAMLQGDYRTSEKLLSRSICLSEAQFFPLINSVSRKYLSRDNVFLQELPGLLFGYMYAQVLQRIKDNRRKIKGREDDYEYEEEYYQDIIGNTKMEINLKRNNKDINSESDKEQQLITQKNNNNIQFSDGRQNEIDRKLISEGRLAAAPFLKNAIAIARKYFIPSSRITEVLLRVQSILDEAESVIINNNNEQTTINNNKTSKSTGMGTAAVTTTTTITTTANTIQSQKNTNNTNTSTTPVNNNNNNNIFGYTNPLITYEIPLILRVLKESGLELNQTEVIRVVRFKSMERQFRKERDSYDRIKQNFQDVKYKYQQQQSSSGSFKMKVTNSIVGNNNSSSNSTLYQDNTLRSGLGVGGNASRVSTEPSSMFNKHNHSRVSNDYLIRESVPLQQQQQQEQNMYFEGNAFKNNNIHNRNHHQYQAMSSRSSINRNNQDKNIANNNNNNSNPMMMTGHRKNSTSQGQSQHKRPSHLKYRHLISEASDGRGDNDQNRLLNRSEEPAYYLNREDEEIDEQQQIQQQDELQRNNKIRRVHHGQSTHAIKDRDQGQQQQQQQQYRRIEKQQQNNYDNNDEDDDNNNSESDSYSSSQSETGLRQPQHKQQQDQQQQQHQIDPRFERKHNMMSNTQKQSEESKDNKKNIANTNNIPTATNTISNKGSEGGDKIINGKNKQNVDQLGQQQQQKTITTNAANNTAQQEYFPKQQQQQTQSGIQSAGGADQSAQRSVQQQQQQQSQQQMIQISNLEENVRTMMTKLLSSSQQLQQEKASGLEEIASLRSMLSNLMESQKTSSQQLQQQQQQFIDAQLQKLNKLEQLQQQIQQQRQVSSYPQQLQQQQSLQSPKQSQFQSTQQQQSQQSTPLLQVLQFLEYSPQQSLAIIKQLSINGKIFSLTSRLRRSGQLELIASDEKQQNQLAKQTLSKDQLKLILLNLNYHPILPATFSLNMCQSNYLLNKYFLLPFLAFDPIQNELKMLSSACGLLSKIQSCVFLNEDVSWWVHHIEGSTFRIVLNKKSKAECLRIDLDMDNGSLKKWFDQLGDNQYDKEEITALLSSTIESEYQRNEQMKELQQRVLRDDIKLDSLKIPKDSEQTYTQRGYRVLNEQQLVIELTELIGVIEETMQSMIQSQGGNGGLFNAITKVPYFARVKIWSITQKKLIQIAYEDTNSNINSSISKSQISSQSSTSIRVILRNAHTTFGPGGVKIRAQGSQFVQVEQIKQIYGLNYSQLHRSEKISLLSHLPDCYALNVHEKNDESLQQKPKPANSEPNNAIVKQQMVSASFVRVMTEINLNQDGIAPLNFGSAGNNKNITNKSHSGYLMPLTLEVLGAAGRLIGIRVMLYNYQTCSESGLFFTVDEQHWLFENKLIIKNSHHMYLDAPPLSQYFISHIFEYILCPILKNHISIVRDTQNPNDFALKLNKGLLAPNSTSVYRIENILTNHLIAENAGKI